MQAHTEPAQPVGWKNVFARPSAKYLAEVAITVVAYFVAGKLGQATTAIRSNNLGPVWPAYGVSVLGVAAAALLTVRAYRRAKARLAALEGEKP
jgi:hypothetical protein